MKSTKTEVSRRSALKSGFLCSIWITSMNHYMAFAEGASAVSVVDLMPEFLKFSREHPTPDLSTVNAFRTQIVVPYSHLYEAFTGPQTDEDLQKYLESVYPLIPSIEVLDAQLRMQVPNMFRRFRKRFPDMVWNGPVFVMANFFGFDGGSGRLDQRDVLVFGLDTIAQQFGSKTDLSVLISHEAFHLYHDQFHPDWLGAKRGKNTPLFRLVWKEGLAVYASGELNASATESDLLLSGSLQEACDRQFPELCAMLRRVLDTTDRSNFMLWMSGSDRTTNIPPRAGYYMGQRAVAARSKQLSVSDMARLDDTAIRSAILSFLDSSMSGGARSDAI